jgi:hypothetical protein
MRTAHATAKPARVTLRARLAAAFARIGSAVDARVAHERTKRFYRSSGAAWTRELV